MKTSVIMIREWDQQMSGSGCCGRLEGDVLGHENERVFAERRAIMEAMGPLYLAIKRECGDSVDLLVVDPRNQISLWSRLWRDFRRHRVGLGDALKTLRAISVSSLVINGRVFSRGAWPDGTPVTDYLKRLSAGRGEPGVVV